MFSQIKNLKISISFFRYWLFTASCCCLLLLSPAAYSQDSLPSAKQAPDTFIIRKLLVIPINPNMFVSDCEKDLMETSKLTFPKMVVRLRAGLAVEVKNHIPGWWESTLLSDNEDSAQDLRLIEVSVDYKYSLLDEKTSGAKKDMLKKKDDKEEKKIVKGQVRIERDDRPKFMNIRMKNDTLIHYLSEKYGVQYLLFMNQLDITSDLSDYAAVANKTYKRFVRVHFTVFKRNGEEYFAGLATAPFPAEINEVETIISKYFPIAAAGVASHLPPPIPVKKVKKK